MKDSKSRAGLVPDSRGVQKSVSTDTTRAVATLHVFNNFLHAFTLNSVLQLVEHCAGQELRSLSHMRHSIASAVVRW